MSDPSKWSKEDREEIEAWLAETRDGVINHAQQMMDLNITPELREMLTSMSVVADQALRLELRYHEKTKTFLLQGNKRGLTYFINQLIWLLERTPSDDFYIDFDDYITPNDEEVNVRLIIKHLSK